RALHSFPTRRSSDLREAHLPPEISGCPPLSACLLHPSSLIPHPSALRPFPRFPRFPSGNKRKSPKHLCASDLRPSDPGTSHQKRSEEHTSELQSLAY